MKKTNLIIAIFILLISFSIAKAQDTTKTDDFNFDDVPVDDQKLLILELVVVCCLCLT